MKFKPNGSWVILPDPTITQTESGIFVGDEAAASNAQRSNVLDVLAVGPMCTFAKKGDTVMIVEAMKTMNHIPSPANGVVKEICVEDGQPVEFGQTIIILE